jgi:superfamily II DNA/RNA helicase
MADQQASADDAVPADIFMDELALRVARHPAFRQAARRAEMARLRRELQLGNPQATDETAKKLIQSAAILAGSSQPALRHLAYRVATNAFYLKKDTDLHFEAAVRVVLTRLGNFPAHRTDPTVAEADSRLPLPLLLEEVLSAEQQTVRVLKKPLVLTRFQHQLWQTISTGADAAVSAPTSAGKSFVLENFLVERFSTNAPTTLAYIVPTRALITQVAADLERSLAALGAGRPAVITVPPDRPDAYPDRAVYVFTPERLQLAVHTLPVLAPDVIVVDEAHLIADGARGVLLQRVIERLVSGNRRPQVLFASPTIANLDIFSSLFELPQMKERRSDDPTIAQNLLNVSITDADAGRVEITGLGAGRSEPRPIGAAEIGRPLRNRFDKLSFIPAALGHGRLNIIYVNGADDAERVALKLVEVLKGRQPTFAQNQLMQLARETVHRRYALVDCLAHGVGFHYSNIPTSLRLAVEAAFSKGQLDFLVCTSTLLQGVNTPAQNIFMFQPEKGSHQPLTAVDFWNLAGRAGRLQQEFQGNIFLIEYDRWRTKPLSGKRSAHIKPALRKSFDTPGELAAVIAGSARESLRGRLDLESAANKLLADFRAGTAEQTFLRLQIDVNDKSFEKIWNTLASASRDITLSDSILGLSPSVSPQKQQSLFDDLRRMVSRNPGTAVLRLSPRNPWDKNAYESYKRILRYCYRAIWDHSENSRLYRFHALIAMRWMRGYPVPRIIQNQLKRNPEKEPRRVIRDTLALIENDIRFKVVRVFTTYNALLSAAYAAEGLYSALETIQPIPLFLEVGASDRTMMSFIEVGASRSLAVELTRRARTRNLQRKQAEEWLVAVQAAELGLSRSMFEEVESLQSALR